MLRIIRASSMGGSGCLLSDFGGSSSLDESVGDIETEFDCSVRYLSEPDTTTTLNKEVERNTDDKHTNKMTETRSYAENIELSGESIEYDQSLQSFPERTDHLTIDAAIEKIGFGKFQLKLMFIAGFSWMADGCEMMLLSIIAPTLKCVWHLSSIREAFMTTVVFVGLMIGGWLWGWASDRYGRKKSIVLSTLCVLYFGILSSQSPSYNWILIIRLMVGFGIGGAPQGVTLVAELLPSSSRSRCIILLELFWAFGSIFAVSLALGVVNSLGWRWYLVLVATPALVFSLFFKWLPESPRYLIAAGKKDEAFKVIQRIAKENGKGMPSGSLYVSEISTPRGRLADLFGKEYRLSTILLWIIWLVAAFSYYGIVLLSTEMFQTHTDSCHPQGISQETSACGCFLLTKKAYTDFLWTTVAEIPGILLTVPIMEYVGRKKTLALEYFAAAVFFLLLMICSNRTVNVILLFCARGCITGAFQAAFVYTPELFPTNVRSIGLGSCSAVARIGAMITPFVAQVLLRSSFFYVASLYATVLIICCIACLLLPIETKGRALEDTTSLSVSYKKPGYDRLR